MVFSGIARKLYKSYMELINLRKQVDDMERKANLPMYQKDVYLDGFGMFSEAQLRYIRELPKTSKYDFLKNPDLSAPSLMLLCNAAKNGENIGRIEHPELYNPSQLAALCSLLAVGADISDFQFVHLTAERMLARATGEYWTVDMPERIYSNELKEIRARYKVDDFLPVSSAGLMDCLLHWRVFWDTLEFPLYNPKAGMRKVDLSDVLEILESGNPPEYFFVPENRWREVLRQRDWYQHEKLVAMRRSATEQGKVVIYQLTEGQDGEFLSYAETDHSAIHEGNYDIIFVDDYHGESLEDLFEKFNLDLPADFHGHSLSVSDVIAINDEHGNRTAFYCDRFGFEEVLDFFPNQNRVLNREQVRMIGDTKCVIIDAWNYQNIEYVIGNVVGDKDFYIASATGREFGNKLFEYDHKPKREEVEDDYIDYEAERDIDRHEAEVDGSSRIYDDEAKEQNNIPINALTGVAASEQTLDVIARCMAGNYVPLEEIENLPEVRTAKSCILHETPTTLRVGREPITNHAIEKMMGYGSVCLDTNGNIAVDEAGNTLYNGIVRQGNRLDIVIGLPASGKSSVIVNDLSQKFQSKVIDSDEAKRMLPEYNNGWGSSVVHEESKIIETAVFNKTIALGENVILPKVGHDSYKIMKNYIIPAKKLGYRVFVHYVELNRNVAMGRMLGRFLDTGRFIEPSVLSKYDNPLVGNRVKATFEALRNSEYVNGYSHWDNTVEKGEKPRLMEHCNMDDFFAQPGMKTQGRKGR